MKIDPNSWHYRLLDWFDATHTRVVFDISDGTLSVWDRVAETVYGRFPNRKRAHIERAALQALYEEQAAGERPQRVDVYA